MQIPLLRIQVQNLNIKYYAKFQNDIIARF